MKVTKEKDPAQLSGFYGWVERAGNKVPHPVYLFLWLFVITVLVSVGLSMIGISAENPVTKEAVNVVNMLKSDMVATFLKSMGKEFMNFAPMLTVPICTLGLGVANGSGLLNTTLKLAGLSKSPLRMTLIISLIGVCGNLVGDAAFIIFPPLVAMLFQGTGRNPLAGLFLAFASVCVGFGANLLVGSADASLAGLTQAAAVLFDPDYVASPMMGYYFLLASTFIMTIACTYVTLKFVEPKLEKTGLGADATVTNADLSYSAPSEIEMKGMKAALLTLIVFFAAVAVMCMKGMPFAAPEKGSVLTGALMKSIPTLIFIMFYSMGFVYGKVTGKIKRFSDTIPMMQSEMKTLASFFVICFFAAQFIAVFRDSNIGLIVAINGGALLKASGVQGPVLLALFVVLTSIVNLFMGSASAKWALLSVVFVPMLMIAGIDPSATQVAYRIGDSLTNNITPTLPYLAIILGYAQEYDVRAKTGTVMAYMLPYTLIGGIVWIAFLLIWAYAGLPMGPGYYAFF